MIEKQFLSVANWQTRRSRQIAFTKKCPEKLTGLMDKIIKDVKPKQKSYASINEIWQQILPCQMQQFCKIAEFKNGILKVKVDSPSVKTALSFGSSEIIGQLNESIGRRKIKEIKFIL